jgi:GTPase SAR1 family protein
VCFSVEAQSSFDNIAAKWLPELKKAEPDTPFIVVGTKCDVREDADITAERLAIGKPMKSPKEYEAVALENGAAAYVECSAITRVNLETLFEDAIRIVRKFTAANADKVKGKKNNYNGGGGQSNGNDRGGEVSNKQPQTQQQGGGGCCVLC